MDNLNGIAAFVRAAEMRSYVAAGRLLGVSASAVGKSVARLDASARARCPCCCSARNCWRY